MTARGLPRNRLPLALTFDFLGLGFARVVVRPRPKGREHRMHNTLWLPFRDLRNSDRHCEHLASASIRACSRASGGRLLRETPALVSDTLATSVLYSTTSALAVGLGARLESIKCVSSAYRHNRPRHRAGAACAGASSARHRFQEAPRVGTYLYLGLATPSLSPFLNSCLCVCCRSGSFPPRPQAARAQSLVPCGRPSRRAR